MEIGARQTASLTQPVNGDQVRGTPTAYMPFATTKLTVRRVSDLLNAVVHIAQRLVRPLVPLVRRFSDAHERPAKIP